jgi:hypothetical protein
VVAAKLSGVAAAVGHMRRLTVEQGVDEVTAILAEAGIRPGTPAAVELLNRAADPYRRTTREGPSWWHPAALEFLVQAGADPQQG